MNHLLNNQFPRSHGLGSTFPCAPNGFLDHRIETLSSGAKGMPLRSL